MPRMDQFNDLIMEEIDNNAVKTLKTHPTEILQRTLYAVDRVFVAKDPDEDSVADKMEAAATMLENIAEAIRNEENPLDIQYPIEDGSYYGNPTFKVGTEFAKTTLIPVAFLNRSFQNRVKKAAKNVAR